MRFRARPVPTLFTLLGVLLLIALGSWQAKRFLEKKSVEEARDSRIVLPVEPLDQDAREAFQRGDLDYRRLEITGQWETDRLFLVRHRIHNGQPGYWIVMGLAIEVDGAEDLRVPVNRGWAPREEAHQIAEELLALPAEGEVTLVGLLHLLDDPVADRGLRRALDEGTLEPTPLLTVGSYDAPAMIQAFEMDLPRPLVVTLGDDAQGVNPGRYPVASYDHITEPYLTAETHFGYALTWYVLALALIAIYIASGLGLLHSRGFDDAPPPQNTA